MAKNENDKVLAVIKVGYDRQWVLPLDEGLDIMRAIAKIEVLRGRPNSDGVIEPLDDEVKLGFILESKIKEMKLAKVLELNGNQNDL